jgi:P-type Ca2+ transporter type 2C
MVTGDNLQTAKAIALECGTLASNENAVEPCIIKGKVFQELSEKEREQVPKKITVCFVLSSIVNDFIPFCMQLDLTY